jgi:CO/xanthine dehydrogenase Mo-binding subunit
VNTRHIAEAFFRSSHLRSPGRIENSFANEAFMDELAAAAKADPAEFRLRYLKDPRAIDVVQAAMKLAGWQARPGRTERGRRAGREGAGSRLATTTRSYVAAVPVEVTRTQADASPASAPVRLRQMVNPDGVATRSKAACCRP